MGHFLVESFEDSALLVTISWSFEIKVKFFGPGILIITVLCPFANLQKMYGGKWSLWRRGESFD